jgi:tRNA(fMet)-specific endonuclease VapC
VAELHYGAQRSASPAKNLSLLARFLPLFTSLAFDDPAAEIYGQLRSQLESTGNLIGPHDTQIAAIALLHRMTLVTHNVAEFSRVPGLTIEDWQVP